MTPRQTGQPWRIFYPWLLLLIASPLWAQAANGELKTFICQGKVADQPAGINFTVSDYKTVIAAHYYFASSGIDMPLSVSGSGDSLELIDQTDGQFKLRLLNPDNHDPEPLTFYNSTGIAGSLTKDGKVLETQFGCSDVREGSSPSRWYADITTESDQHFEKRVRLFLDGVLSGNREQAAAAVSWSLKVNARKPYSLRNRRAFLKQWDVLFNPAALEELRNAIPHEMFKRDGMAMVANGAVWFDAKGAKVLNLPSVKPAQ